MLDQRRVQACPNRLASRSLRSSSDALAQETWIFPVTFSGAIALHRWRASTHWGCKPEETTTTVTFDSTFLVQAARRGDHDAFTTLVHRTRPLLRGAVGRRVGPQPAEDLVQETYLEGCLDCRGFREEVAQLEDRVRESPELRAQAATNAARVLAAIEGLRGAACSACAGRARPHGGAARPARAGRDRLCSRAPGPAGGGVAFHWGADRDRAGTCCPDRGTVEGKRETLALQREEEAEESAQHAVLRSAAEPGGRRACRRGRSLTKRVVRGASAPFSARGPFAAPSGRAYFDVGRVASKIKWTDLSFSVPTPQKLAPISLGASSTKGNVCLCLSVASWRLQAARWAGELWESQDPPLGLFRAPVQFWDFE